MTFFLKVPLREKKKRRFVGAGWCEPAAGGSGKRAQSTRLFMGMFPNEKVRRYSFINVTKSHLYFSFTRKYSKDIRLH